jgi:hypothetical protein
VRERLLEQLVDCVGVPSDVAKAMTWDQVREMHAAGIEIGAHTVNHPILPKLSVEEQRREVVEGRSKIAQILCSAPRAYAYPNGNHVDVTVSVVREAGFTCACTTVRGSNAPGCDLFRLNRVGIGADAASLIGMRLTGLIGSTLNSAPRVRDDRTDAAQP